ncbi:MAG TPA: hypothetical protein VNJ08_02330 [Bacteriovoracaceae bacterium]|nr:hypothetical protein [Bacteriovoracaceae bacterium]
MNKNELISKVTSRSLLGCMFLQWRRKNIFIKNFKFSHLEVAETCSISPDDYSSFGIRNVFPFQGRVYKVNEKKNIYVIYNGTKSKKIQGRLLKYGNQHYLIPEKWVADKTTKKVAKAG